MKIKIYIFILIIFAACINSTYANIFFSEIFPNTVDDKNLEYVELYNSLDTEESLSWFILSDKSWKEYIFSNSEVLQPWEKKKYLRTLTKIILNNSDEELYLKDNLWNIIDNYNYSSSIKWEVIEIPLSCPVDTPSDKFSSPWQEKEATNTWELVEENNIKIPEVVFSFQSATYLLEKEKILETYICDSSKEACKINLDFRNSFIWDFKESDYNCETDFSFTNDQENRCNPATIIVPVWTFYFKIKIVSKENSEKYSEKTFKILNSWYIKPVSKSKTTTTTLTKSISSTKKPNHPIDPVVISKPKIIVQSWLNDQNICINKNNCNINFKYIEKSKFEKCKWNFWWWIYAPWINGKCDPSYVKYWTWEFIVTLKVYEKRDSSNFKINKIVFGNWVVPNSQLLSPDKEREFKREVFEGTEWIQIHGVMPNPNWSDNFEYIELINNSDKNYNLKWCAIDDILDWWSKEFTFKVDEILKPWEIKKYFKETTKLNLNNDEDEVNLFCHGKLVDVLKRDFDVKSWYYLDHAKLDVTSWKAKVVDVIDWDTIKIQFLWSDKIENFRLVWIDTPETKHPNKKVEQYWKEAYEFVLNNLKAKEVYLELDSENIRDTYNRLLGFVYLNWENYNKKIITEWYSKAYLDYDFKYKDDFIEAEKVAQKAKVKITIQWKIWKNKSLNWNKIICYDICSINFDGRESEWNIKKYSWDFWNWEKFEGVNPWYIKYEKYWNYKVYLATVSESWDLDIEEFYVTYTKTQKKQKASIIPKVSAEDNIINETKIVEAELINEIWNEDSNYSLLLYMIIAIFWILIWVVILKREKLI